VGVASTTTFNLRFGTIAAGPSIGIVQLPVRTASATATPWRWEVDGIVISSGGTKVVWSAAMGEASVTAGVTDFQRTRGGLSTVIDPTVITDLKVTAMHGVANANLSTLVSGAMCFITDPL